MALLHFLFAVLIIGPWIFSFLGYFIGRKSSISKSVPSDRKPISYYSIINSALLYALAYNIIFFLQELFLALGKRWIGLKAYLYHNNHSWEGSDPRAPLMQGLGALAIFLFGWIFLWFFFQRRTHNSWTTLFLLWLAHHGLIQSLPQLSSVPLDRSSDAGQAITYLQLNSSVEYLLSYGSIIAIVFLAYFFAKWFLSFTPESNPLNHPFLKFRAIFKLVILPGIIGTLILFPYRIFPIDRYQATVMLLLVCIPSIFAFSWIAKPGHRISTEIHEKVLITPVILLIVVLIFFQVVLAPGISF